MTTETYNGWKNYATWGVALVLDNDRGTYDMVRERAQETLADAPDHPNVPEVWTPSQAATFELEDWLKDFTEELCGLEGEERGVPEPSLMARQVISAGLADVDWREIAENVLSGLEA